MGVQEDRWDKGGTKPADDYKFLFGIMNDNHPFGRRFFINDGIGYGDWIRIPLFGNACLKSSIVHMLCFSGYSYVLMSKKSHMV